jgi:hypothetical protein
METPTRKPYPTDLSDEEWWFVAPYLTLLRECKGRSWSRPEAGIKVDQVELVPWSDRVSSSNEVAERRHLPWLMRSPTATGSSQWGQSPPGPTRRQKSWQSAQRCSPR